MHASLPSHTPETALILKDTESQHVVASSANAGSCNTYVRMYSSYLIRYLQIALEYANRMPQTNHCHSTGTLTPRGTPQPDHGSDRGVGHHLK